MKIKSMYCYIIKRNKIRGRINVTGGKVHKKASSTHDGGIFFLGQGWHHGGHQGFLLYPGRFQFRAFCLPSQRGELLLKWVKCLGDGKTDWKVLPQRLIRYEEILSLSNLLYVRGNRRHPRILDKARAPTQNNLQGSRIARPVIPKTITSKIRRRGKLIRRQSVRNTKNPAIIQGLKGKVRISPQRRKLVTLKIAIN